MCTVDFDGTCSVFRSEHRRARKPHRCFTCGTEIRVGRQYRSLFAIYDGEPYNEKQCTACERIGARFRKDHGTEPFPGSLLEIIDECINSDDADSKRWKVDAYRIRRRREKARIARGIHPLAPTGAS